MENQEKSTLPCCHSRATVALTSDCLSFCTFVCRCHIRSFVLLYGQNCALVCRWPLSSKSRTWISAQIFLSVCHWICCRNKREYSIWNPVELMAMVTYLDFILFNFALNTFFRFAFCVFSHISYCSNEPSELPPFFDASREVFAPKLCGRGLSIIIASIGGSSIFGGITSSSCVSTSWTKLHGEDASNQISVLGSITTSVVRSTFKSVSIVSCCLSLTQSWLGVSCFSSILCNSTETLAKCVGSILRKSMSACSHIRRKLKASRIHMTHLMQTFCGNPSSVATYKSEFLWISNGELWASNLPGRWRMSSL